MKLFQDCDYSILNIVQIFALKHGHLALELKLIYLRIVTIFFRGLSK